MLRRPLRNVRIRIMTDYSFQTLHSDGGARVIFRGVVGKVLRADGAIRRNFRQRTLHFRLDFRQVGWYYRRRFDHISPR